MIEAGKCVGCGLELPKDAPKGLCPECLLRQGLVLEPLQFPAPNTTATLHPRIHPRMTRMGGNPPSSYPCNPWSISKKVSL